MRTEPNSSSDIEVGQVCTARPPVDASPIEPEVVTKDRRGGEYAQWLLIAIIPML